MKKTSKFSVLILLPGLLLAAPQVSIAAHLGAKEGGWSNRRSDATEPWFTLGSASTARVRWTSGPNSLDTTGYALVTYGPEPKFTTTAGTLVGRTFTGFVRTDGPGVRGSWNSTSGSGSSGVGLVVYYADIKVVATGLLGGGAPPPTPEWSADATGKDPWPMFANDLPDPSQLIYDMYAPVGIMEGAPGNGRIRFHNYYETATSMVDLLDVEIAANSVTVSGNANAAYYMLPDIDVVPVTAPANQVTLSWIHDYLYNQIIATGSITNPLYLGIYSNDIPIPTVDMGDGVMANVHGDIEASDLAAVPEPNSLIALGMGAALLARWRGRHR